MNQALLIAGIIAIVFGVIILVWPRMPAYIVAVYLLIVGVPAIIAAI